MRICTLLSSYERSESPFRGVDTYVDPSRWLPEHDWETHLIDKATAVRSVRRLARRGFDVFVSLCDGAWEEDRAGVEVVVELERQGQAYTGADPHFFEPTRRAMKLVCPDMGVDTPRYIFARGRVEVELAASHLRFPFLVKHPSSYGSVGLTKDSRVETADQLLAQVGRMADEFGEALVEEFVEGREFTVLVAEPGEGETSPRAYPPIEVGFPPGESFKHFELKWDGWAAMGDRPVEEAGLAARLTHAARQVFVGMGGVGYARCDFRADRDGRLFLIDVNPNAGVFYPPGQYGAADLILSHHPGGQREFLDHIIACALRRRERRRPKWKVEYHPASGYGLVADVNLRASERILIKEERPHRLVSRGHVERTWDDWQIELFRRYSYPHSENVSIIWSDRPEEWFPINHSCDPNLVPDGLDFIARRPIRKGEAITLDYATTCGPDLPEFTCRCGTPCCRGSIRGTDYLEPWVEDRYGANVADFVRQSYVSRRRSGDGR